MPYRRTRQFRSSRGRRGGRYIWLRDRITGANVNLASDQNVWVADLLWKARNPSVATRENLPTNYNISTVGATVVRCKFECTYSFLGTNAPAWNAGIYLGIQVGDFFTPTASASSYGVDDAAAWDPADVASLTNSWMYWRCKHHWLDSTETSISSTVGVLPDLYGGTFTGMTAGKRVLRNPGDTLVLSARANGTHGIGNIVVTSQTLLRLP